MTKRLTNNESELLSKSFGPIKDKLRKTIAKTKIARSNNECLMFLDEAISFLPDVYLEFDQNKTTSSFECFAANRCFFRLIDQLRKQDRHRVRGERSRINAIKDQVYKERGFCDSDEIKRRLGKTSKNVDKYIWFKDRKRVDISEANNVLDTDNVQKIEWEDVKTHIMENLDREFPRSCSDKFSSEFVLTVHRKIIQEYLLPKAEGKKFKTLKQISQDTGLSYSRVYAICTGQKMRDFVNRCFGNDL